MNENATRYQVLVVALLLVVYWCTLEYTIISFLTNYQESTRYHVL